MLLLWLILTGCYVVYWTAASHNESNITYPSTEDRTISLLVSVPPTSNGSVESDVYVFAAVMLAGEYVNNKSRAVSKGERLAKIGLHIDIVFDEVGDDPTEALATYIRQTFRTNNRVPDLRAIITSGLSDVAEPTVYISGTKQSIVSLSYGAPDTIFNNDRNRYPYFHRMLPSEEAVNIAKLKLLKIMQWKRVALLSAGSPTYSRSTENFAKLALSENITLSLVRKLSFDVEAVFQEMLRREVKIIMGFFGPIDARNVLCQASTFNNGILLDESHVWILPHYHHPHWWRVKQFNKPPLGSHNHHFMECSAKDMTQSLAGVLFVDSLKYNVIQENDTENDTEADVHRLDDTVPSFVDKLHRKVEKLFPSQTNLDQFLRQSRAAASYDAVVMLALALEETLKSETLNNSRDLNETLSNMKLKGLAKFHHLTRSQDFRFTVLISQQSPDGRLKPVNVVIGEYTDAFCSTCRVINLSNETEIYLPGFTTDDYSDYCWKGGGAAPSDGFLEKVSHITSTTFIITGAILFLSLSISIIYVIAMIVFRHNRHMKVSSPKLMLVAILGFISVLPSSIIFGLTISRLHYELSEELVDALCIMEPILTHTGFTLAFSIFLVKNWRIYRIFHNPRNTDLEYLSDRHLLLRFIAWVLPYLCILLLWLSFSTPKSITEPIKVTMLPNSQC